MTSTSTNPQQPVYNKKSPTVKRILREAAELASTPSTSYHAAPLEHNLFEWHFTLRGPPSTPYARGIYHGRITLPPAYPLRPPSFRFLTPSGRFEVNREICLSISGHHEDTWQPAWGVRTAVVALRSFMEQEPEGQVGGVVCTEKVRKTLAEESRAWRCTECGVRWEDVLEEEEEKEDGREREEEKVPEELKLAYRGENKEVKAVETTLTEPETVTAVGNSTGTEAGTSGSVETPGLHRRVPAPQQQLSPPPTSSTQTQPQLQPSPQPQIQIIHQDDENFWIDRAIAICVILLAGIILKRLLAGMVDFV
ncbi:UBC-like protein [Ascodesmis nigricans]|uniref:UBC-like protein n=1 Tax=Ascodesmis nigricans TaxID=341454 RepID=A0A4S2MVH1_9PEZI|nr:UBC-like protein [Ascodesmis nigricans]